MAGARPWQGDGAGFTAREAIADLLLMQRTLGTELHGNVEAWVWNGLHICIAFQVHKVVLAQVLPRLLFCSHVAGC